MGLAGLSSLELCCGNGGRSDGWLAFSLSNHPEQLTFIGKYRNQAGTDQRQAAEHIENLIRFNNVVAGPLLDAVKVISLPALFPSNLCRLDKCQSCITCSQCNSRH